MSGTGNGSSGDPFDLVVIGGGSAGLSGADFAAKLGARVALVERHRIGGDCTWTGCVPSKALIKAAKIAHEAKRAAAFGIEAGSPRQQQQQQRADMARVHAYVQQAIGRVYQDETPQALESRGISVFLGAAEFVDPHAVRAGERTIRANHFIIATGARPRIPEIPGLSGVPYVTYESFFDRDRLPEHLVVLGAGPIGLELAQAYRRLGAEVSVVGEEFLPREEPEVRRLMERLLGNEGVQCVPGKALSVHRTDGERIALSTKEGDVTGDLLLVATGRQPNVAGLGLDRAGVAHSGRGIEVDRCLRTSARHIYAAGDVIGGPQFTHLAAWQCFQAVRNALLPGSTRAVPDALPAVTFTDPEVAHVGASEADARASRGDQVRVHLWDMDHADRAVCDGETEGFIKLVTRAGGTILGATIVAARAGEMISELALAVDKRLTVADVAATIHPYPTWSTALQQLAARAAVESFIGGAAGKIALRLARWLD